MKGGFLRWAAGKALQNLPALSVLALVVSAQQFAPSKWMGGLFTFAGAALGVALFQVVDLRERVARLEHLLTALTPESAGYRKEITTYDQHPLPPLILPPDK